MSDIDALIESTSEGRGDDEDDHETYEIFGREIALKSHQKCLYCNHMVIDETDSVWAKNGPMYSPFCNAEHQQKFQDNGAMINYSAPLSEV